MKSVPSATCDRTTWHIRVLCGVGLFWDKPVSRVNLSLLLILQPWPHELLSLPQLCPLLWHRSSGRCQRHLTQASEEHGEEAQPVSVTLEPQKGPISVGEAGPLTTQASGARAKVTSSPLTIVVYNMPWAQPISKSIHPSPLLSLAWTTTISYLGHSNSTPTGFWPHPCPNNPFSTR